MSDMISKEAVEVFLPEALFGAGCSVDQVDAAMKCVNSLIVVQNHTPAAPAVKMKPLVWEYSETTYTADRETGRQEKAGLFWQAYCRVSTRSYTIMKLVDPRVKGDKESYRLIIGDTDQRFPSLEAAQEIANARHRARILSALEGGEV